MKSKRTFALLEVYEKDNYSIVEAITRGQAEGSTEKENKGRKAAQYVQDTPDFENVLQSRKGKEKESTIIDSCIESEDGEVSVHSIPFLQIIYSDNDIDNSYKEKESVTTADASSTWSVIGYVWPMMLSELSIIAEEKKEMSITNSNIKAIYDNTHDLASRKLLKPADIDKRLFLSALFDISRLSNPIDHRYLVPLRDFVVFDHV
ncbi:hypothetical protein RMATCC62417_03076 [Rhizopus microsporus]|nr:hypothetical protein RMATCC62417_03076 [Rhizopus microsporus]